MLEPPVISDALILEVLRSDYDLDASRLTFLQLGADVNTAVYRVKAGGTDYFLKLRKGDFDEVSLTVPRFLHEQGLNSIITPLETCEGRLWGMVDAYRTILYPYVSGQDGYERDPSRAQWLDFGAAMRAIHEAELPPTLRSRIPRDTFSPLWRERVREFQRQAETDQFDDPIAANLAAFIRTHRADIERLVDTAERLGAEGQSRGRPFVLCHADMHPGNLLLPNADSSALYIVDWDQPVYAPRERDLALIGGTYAWRRPDDTALFYRAYHAAGAGAPAEIDLAAIRYYRCERIVVDMAEFCQQLLTTSTGGEDRVQSFRYFTGAFQPGREVELALGRNTGR